MRAGAQVFQVPTVGGKEIAVDYGLDLAAIPLDPAFVEDISLYAAVFNLHGHLNEGKMLAARVIGHPATRNSQKRLGEPAPDHALAILVPATLMAPKRFTPAEGADYLFLEMNHKGYLNDDGTSLTPPQLSGMSGGPVLGLYDIDDELWIEFEGIFTEWHKADRIGVALRRTTIYASLHAWEFGELSE